jgi:peptidoglycan hydrolase-like protein with peptidoglycan-binding domain
VRKQRSKGPSLALDDTASSSVRGWRKDAVAAAVAAAALTAVVVNAAFLQTGPHPAPLFADRWAASPAEAPKSIRVVGQEITGPPLPVASPKGRAVEPEPARLEPTRPEPARIEPVRNEAPAVPRPRNEVIADIQRELAQRGFYDGTADGLHGPKTDAAMRDFEQAAGLRPGSEPNDVFLRALQRSQAKAAPRTAAAQPQAPDPIAELIAPSSKRILAVQRALTDYGYGQFKPNGNLGPETKNAIEQFERARKMPVTGQISPRLVRELSVVTGRQLD